jgi:hypothetical protein
MVYRSKHVECILDKLNCCFDGNYKLPSIYYKYEGINSIKIYIAILYI